MADQLIFSEIGDVVRDKISGATKSLHIFSPYITLSGLKHLLDDVTCDTISVYTTWDRDDIASGASDVGIYPYLKEHQANLFLHDRLHMKGVLIDSDSFILGSANMTQNGLGLNSHPNVECMTLVNPLGLNDRLSLMSLMQNSIPVTPEMYREALAIEVPAIKRVVEEPLLWPDAPADFLVSRLPCYSSPRGLVDVVASLTPEIIAQPDEEQRYALHDIALYGLRAGENSEACWERLVASFFVQPFIQAFCEFVKERSRYFGETKEWIQKTCVDDPAPHKRDLTERIRILFDWIVELAPEQFEISRPNHSECLAFVGERSGMLMYQAAEKALGEIGQPTHLKDLVAYMAEKDYFNFGAKSPTSALGCCLSRHADNVDISRHNQKEVFHRHAPAMYGLIEQNG